MVLEKELKNYSSSNILLTQLFIHIQKSSNIKFGWVGVCVCVCVYVYVFKKIRNETLWSQKGAKETMLSLDAERRKATQASHTRS